MLQAALALATGQGTRRLIATVEPARHSVEDLAPGICRMKSLPEGRDKCLAACDITVSW